MYGQPWTMYTPQMYPNVGGAQVAPQGFFGNLLGHLAGPVGQGIGGLLGQPQVGGQIGQALGSLGHLLPFQAVLSQVPWGGQPQFGGQFGPQLAWGGQFGYPGGQLAPQGFFGNVLGQFAGPAGQAIGGWFGQPQVGGQIGQALGSLGHLLPFQAVPMPIHQGLPGVPPYLGSPLPYQGVPMPTPQGFPGGIVPPYLGSPLPYQGVPVTA